MTTSSAPTTEAAETTPPAVEQQDVEAARATKAIAGDATALPTGALARLRYAATAKLTRNLEEDSWPLIKRLIRESVPLYWKRYAVAFGLMAIVAAMTALSAYIMRDVVNGVVVDRDVAKTRIIAGIVMAIFLIKGLASFGQTVILSRIGNAIVAQKQRQMFNAVLAHGMEFFNEHASSLLVTQFSHNAQAARNALTLLVTSIGRDLLTLIALIGVMVWMQPVMSLLAVTVAPIAIVGIVSLVRKVRRVAKAEFFSLSRIVMAMQETVQGIRVVKSFNLEDAMRGRMFEAIESVEDRANRIAHLSARTSPLMETLGGVAIAGVILVSSWMIIEGGQTPGAFMSFLTALLLAYEPAKRLARLQVNMEAFLIGVRLMFELIDRPVQLSDAPGAEAVRISRANIRFDDVSFAYEPEKSILKGLSFDVPAGTSCALVGPSGGGKSTIMALLLRLYDPQSGKIQIDGHAIDAITLRSLRDAIAYVGQDTYLFSGTVRENLMNGRPEASQDEMITAAKAANAHDFISALPQGYYTDIGENGAQLSGGQKQRVAIARALLKDAAIVLLDEATSALDSESERLVQDALDRLLENRTSIIIAHRLSTIRGADKICVVSEGSIVEQGTHAELLAERSLYNKLHDLQFGVSADAA
ncbi:MAG: ABC transporter ATP-binding protein [Pseudomonadota bacterium]